MAGDQFELAVVLRAKDDGASAKLEKFKADVLATVKVMEQSLGAGSTKVGKEVENLEAGVTKTSRAVRELTIPLAQGLSPALQGVSRDIAGVITGAAALSSGIGALAIGAVGLVGVLGGQLLETWRKNTEAALEFNRAIRSMDFSRITEQGQK